MLKELLYIKTYDEKGFKDIWRQRQKELEVKIVSGYKNWERQYSDLEAITRQFLGQGDAVVELFGWGLPAIPSFVKSKIGKKGRLYLIEGDSDCEFTILLSFIEMYESFARLRLGLETHYHNHGTPLTLIHNRPYLGWLRRALESVDIERAKLLKSKVHDNTANSEIRQIAKQFCDNMGIEAITAVIPPYPNILPSVDAVIEHNGFSFLYEEQKEGVIIGADQILKPGGYLIFQETSSELISIQYYGEEIFKEKYTQIMPSKLHYTYDWLVFRKHTK